MWYTIYSTMMLLDRDLGVPPYLIKHAVTNLHPYLIKHAVTNLHIDDLTDLVYEFTISIVAVETNADYF